MRHILVNNTYLLKAGYSLLNGMLFSHVIGVYWLVMMLAPYIHLDLNKFKEKEKEK